jgi:4-hydroxyphenylpyruvate dioxygenase
LQLPAIVAPGGSHIHFVPDGVDAVRFEEIDFLATETAAEAEHLLQKIDHIALGMPQDQLDTWVLFCRAVLGLMPGDSLELADPFGLIRTSSVSNAERSLRFVLNVSVSQRTRTARTITASGGAGVHHIAFACDDIFTAVERMRGQGARFVPISANYYEDLPTRFDLVPAQVSRMKALGILFDRSAEGDYLHIYTESFADRFFFELVQRIDRYDAYGALNAPARMASQAQNSEPPAREHVVGPPVERR